MTIVFLSPAEASKRLGVSVRALRLYERHGLVLPQRTAAGWRVYGPDHLARLHKVLALKGLGLPLTRIADLLTGREVGLDAILALQEAVLRTRRSELDRVLGAIRSARARLACGEALSLDDLVTLTQETQMTDQMSGDQWRATFEPLWRKHFTPAEYDRIAAQKREAFSKVGDPQTFARAWEEVIADATRLMEAGDPKAPAARAVLGRWRELSNFLTEADPELNAKAAAVWQEALSDPGVAERLPVNQALWAFMREVARAADAPEGG